MAMMNTKLDLPKEETELLAQDSDWDNTTVTDLAKLFEETLHTCFHDAINEIIKNGYSKDAAEDMILKCGPFYGIKDTVSSIVNRALDCLKIEKSRTWFTFNDLNTVVEYTMLEMVTMLRSVKPSLSVHEALWTLLLCDLNVIIASESEIDPQKFLIRSLVKPVQEECTVSKTEIPCQDQETVDSDVTKLSSKLRRSDEKCRCCRKWYSGDAYRKNPFCYDDPLTLLAKAASADKKSPKEAKPATPKPEPVPPEPCRTGEIYLSGIPVDETTGERVPQDDKDELILFAVGQLQSMQKEVKMWDDWASVKVMQVAKRLGQDRQEVKKLKAKSLEKDKEAMEESTRKKLSEMTTALTTTQNMIHMCTSAIVLLESEKSVLQSEKERAENQSVFEAKRVEEALCTEKEVLKQCESCEFEKKLLEEDLKSLKRETGPKQRELEKAKHLVQETKRRIAKEEEDVSKILAQAESMRSERERVDALAKAREERYLKRVEKELNRYETEIKQIQYEIAALNLEAETKKIAAMKWPVSEESPKNTYARRECVMCLTEEMTVLFVPCGHQVLCGKCNVIHEENGMKDCPSCRTPVQKRINCLFS